ncbi:phosphotransferase [Paenibacillus sanfengchensis]|uniref:phosphotransferase n=1 Tax=Paenibacillus sanfengchensis TaxID=3119819 RepID=UPI002FE3C281
MVQWSEYVRADGTLDGEKVWRREPLYQGMNGRYVERFYPEKTGPGYIFKPLTNGKNPEREAWIYRHVLDSFPPIYPRLLASSEEGAGEAGWSIFEDLGPLRHEFRLELALEVVKRMAWWHAFPETHWRGLGSSGPKPPIEQIAADVGSRREEMVLLLKEAGLSLDPAVLDKLIYGFTEGTFLSTFRVLSHGDLHLGNYAKGANGRLYILDWEHAHLNSPFWDLYHLIDMSHPMFPKRLRRSEREKLLDYYIKQSVYHGRKWDGEEFIQGYCRYAALFSLWMLLLINGDLERGDSVWPKGRLLAQWAETLANLSGCLDRLSLDGGDVKEPSGRRRVVGGDI